MLQRISQSSVAWQQRHPRGHGDMMIEWLSQCEQEAEGIRKSRHTQVSHCGVSLEEKLAERPQARRASRRRARPWEECWAHGDWPARVLARRHASPRPSHTNRCTTSHLHLSAMPMEGAHCLHTALKTVCPRATSTLPPCQTRHMAQPREEWGQCWKISAKPAFTLDASGFCVPLSNAGDSLVGRLCLVRPHCHQGKYLFTF